MAIGLITDEGSVFVEVESTEGVYVEEQAGGSAIEVLSDGLEFTPTKELLERNNRTSTVEKVAGRVGQKSMAGTVPVEFKAAENSGQPPETAPLWQALLGGVRSVVGRVSGTTHTTTRINLAAGEGAQYTVGDIVRIREYDLDSNNPDHVSFVSGTDDDWVDLGIPYHQNFSDGVEVSDSTIFFHQGDAPTLSITNYIGGEIREKAIGMRPVSCEISNFSTGQLSQASFSLEGLDFDREDGSPIFAPAYDNSLPPVTLCAKVFRDDVEYVLNSVTINMANTLGFLTSTASCSGKISSRITEFVTTFTLNPYMDDSQLTEFDAFVQNAPYGVFGSAHNQGGNENQHLNNVAFYMPNCRTNELTTGDEDGIVTDAISGQAYKLNGNDTIFIAFI